MFGNLSERTKSWVVKAILVMISVPFALFGVDYYFRHGGGGSDTIASVEGQDISRYELERGVRQQVEQLRGMFGKNFDPAMFEGPQMRLSVLDGIVNQRLLAHEATKSGMVVTDASLASRIQEIGAFQGGDGKFSEERYRDVLRREGMTPAGFEGTMRRDELVQMARDSISETTIAPRVAVDAFVRYSEQQRTISVLQFQADQFLTEVKLAPDAVRKFYDTHKDEFKTPEQVKVDYVVLSQDALATTIAVSPDEIKAAYEEGKKKGLYQLPEERQASHILVTADAKATPEARKAAQAKADALYKEVLANPDKFAEIATRDSQDPGSAKQGGDLGFFRRGAMVKPFEDAVFSMKPGEIKGPIQSDFGYHIIRLTAIKPEKVRTLEEATADIKADLQKQKAGRQFADSAETLGTRAFEDSASLAPVAKAVGLEIKHGDWVSASGLAGDPILGSPKLMQAVFAPEALKDRRNTQPIEVSQNTLAVAHVVDYRAAVQKPLEEVAAGIKTRLEREEAGRLAVAKGKATLERLRKGENVDGLTWAEGKTVTRTGQSDIAPAVVAAAFKTDAHKLPAYAGAESPGPSFAIARIDKVTDGSADDAKRKSVETQVARSLAQDELGALILSLRSSSSVTVQKDLLQQKTSDRN